MLRQTNELCGKAKHVVKEMAESLRSGATSRRIEVHLLKNVHCLRVVWSSSCFSSLLHPLSCHVLLAIAATLIPNKSIGNHLSTEDGGYEAFHRLGPGGHFLRIPLRQLLAERERVILRDRCFSRCACRVLPLPAMGGRRSQHLFRCDHCSNQRRPKYPRRSRVELTSLCLRTCFCGPFRMCS